MQEMAIQVVHNTSQSTGKAGQTVEKASQRARNDMSKCQKIPVKVSNNQPQKLRSNRQTGKLIPYCYEPFWSTLHNNSHF